MLVIGEKINGMYKEVGKAIREKDKETIQKLAKDQVEAGALCSVDHFSVKFLL